MICLTHHSSILPPHPEVEPPHCWRVHCERNEGECIYMEEPVHSCEWDTCKCGATWAGDCVCPSRPELGDCPVCEWEYQRERETAA